MDPDGRPERVSGRAAISRYDANNGWGHHAGRVAMDAAIAGARDAGSHTVVMYGSNHYGIAGWYALRAAAAGLIGISLTNTSPIVAPTRAVDPLLGTNPIAAAAPAGRHGTFCLDMATSTITRGRVEVAARRDETLQPGWAVDADGRPTTDAQAAFDGALQPLGGEERTGGHKGYGLTLLVDILTGVLAGATAGPEIVPLFSPVHGRSDLGQTFIAIDPAAIDDAGAFERRLEHELDLLVAARSAPDAAGPVLIPGQPETAAEQRSAELGVVIDREHHHSLTTLADHYRVPFPDTLDD